ncbi:hypothetical protein BKA69DRAFT_1125898 [Paraphysoderma sedebokerense]|nr:hypothetical protein BKA69DRAFT_1125898 [Paraphysoderma sedebokerense]
MLTDTETLILFETSARRIPVLVLFAIPCFVLNLLVILRLCGRQGSIAPSQIPFLCLAVGESALPLSVAIFQVKLLLNENHLPYTECLIDGILTVLLSAISILTFFIIALDRYLIIVRNQTLSVKRMLKMLAPTWFLSVVFAIFPIFAGTRVLPRPAEVYCIHDTRPSTFPYRFFTIGCIFFMALAMLGTSFLYYMVYRKVKYEGFNSYSKNSSPSLKNTSDSANSKSISNVQQAMISSSISTANYQRQVSVTKKLAFMTTVYFIAWFPMGIAFMYETATGEYIGKELDFVAACMAFLQGMSNSLIILFLDNRWKVNLPNCFTRKKTVPI